VRPWNKAGWYERFEDQNGKGRASSVFHFGEKPTISVGSGAGLQARRAIFPQMRFLRNIVCHMFVALIVSCGTAFAAPHLIVDMKSGKVLSRQQEFDRWYPASLTKLMTAYVAFKEVKSGRISLSSPVKITAEALSRPPSKMGFPEGSILTVDAALKLLMVKSANDVATAIAESVAGSEPAFVQLMNAAAQRLGMRDTRFVNPHGLFDPGQYTTARDLAILTIAIRSEFPGYAGYFAIPAVKVGKKLLRNHNPLLQRFDGTTGMKTGFVCASGLNIVATVKRNGKELVAVVLGGPTGRERNVRAARLLAEAFSKNSFLSTARIDTMRPSGPVNRMPTDMRDEVCGKKKRVTESGEDEPASASFALAKPGQQPLEELEAIYLKPKGANTRVIAVSLGNATGPDPYGLLGGKAEESLTAFTPEETASAPWPIVPGTKGLRVPVPEPSPRQ
jgi:D-alanyl-D-alanine carboxypeptidase